MKKIFIIFILLIVLNLSFVDASKIWEVGNFSFGDKYSILNPSIYIIDNINYSELNGSFNYIITNGSFITDVCFSNNTKCTNRGNTSAEIVVAVVTQGYYNATQINLTILQNEAGNLGINITYFKNLDTNDSTRFFNLTNFDCSGTDKVTGIDVNGTIICAADQSGSASDTGDYNASKINVTTFYNESGNLAINYTYYRRLIEDIVNFFSYYNSSRINLSSLQTEGSNLGLNSSYLLTTTEDVVLPWNYYNVSKINLTVIKNESGSLGINFTFFKNLDTNESSRLNTLTATDCSGTNKMTGVGADGSVVCGTDQTGGSSSILFNKTVIDIITTNTTHFNESVISLSVSANTNYTYECTLIGNSSATTVGVQINVSVPPSPTWNFVTIENPTTTTAPLYTVCAYTRRDCLSLPTAGVVGDGAPIIIKGRLINGANANQIQVFLRAEAAGTVRIKQESWCQAEIMN